MRFKFSKLVRDKIIPQMQAAGSKPVYKQLSRPLYFKALVAQLSLDEDTVELTSELADVEEIVLALTKLLGISREDLELARQKKSAKVGSFEDRLFIESVETRADSKWGKYYLDNPDKYPVISW